MSKTRSRSLDDLPPSVCNTCGDTFDPDVERDCPALDDGVCAP